MTRNQNHRQSNCAASSSRNNTYLIALLCSTFMFAGAASAQQISPAELGARPAPVQAPRISIQTQSPSTPMVAPVTSVNQASQQAEQSDGDTIDQQYDRIQRNIDERTAVMERRITPQSSQGQTSLPRASVDPYSSDLDLMQKLQREISILRLQKEKTELLTQIYETVYSEEENGDNSDGGQTDNSTEPQQGAQTFEFVQQTSQNRGIFRAENGFTFEADIDQNRAPILSTIGPAPQQGSTGAQPAAGASERTTFIPPVFTVVMGSGENLRAIILMPNFGEVEARQGDLLPDGSIVSNIGLNRVEIQTRSGESLVLRQDSRISFPR